VIEIGNPKRGAPVFIVDASHIEERGIIVDSAKVEETL
jgi:hypothetical protein